jgi:hypothetical protein
MKRANTDQILSAVFVDYDNIYLSLKRKNEEAARRFAKDTQRWIAAIQSGELITPNNAYGPTLARRTVMNRCYGNPVPRRNASDNKTDMESFPFVRHHFLRAGFEIIDCPPLTAQLKNSSDIKMVMDLRDFLTHETYFDEFVILSSDADFTPVLHRLRAHNRTTTIYVNDNTAAPYTAIADAEIREDDVIALLLGTPLQDEAPAEAAVEITTDAPAKSISSDMSLIAGRIIDVVADAVRTAPAPLPLEAAAERATRVLGAELTTETQWAGAGGFLELLRTKLPEDIRLSNQTPPVLFDQSRVISSPPPQIAQQDAERVEAAPPAAPEVDLAAEAEAERQRAAEAARRAAEAERQRAEAAAKAQAEADQIAREREEAAARAEAEAARKAAEKAAEEEAAALAAQKAKVAAEIQQSIAKIHEASQAPPLSPPEYAILFQELAAEIAENELQGVQTLSNVEKRLETHGVDIRREDIRFVLGVVGEQDPWFEQGSSASLFAGRFRNFVVDRCRAQNLTLAANELELIETWFAGAVQAPPPRPNPPARPETQASGTSDTWWDADDQPATAKPQAPSGYDARPEQKLDGDEALPRMLRS